MTPERLAEIRAASREGSADWSDPITDARDLLAEVDRLRAQVAAVRSLIGYGYGVTRSADQGGGCAIVIEETDLEDALASGGDS